MATVVRKTHHLVVLIAAFIDSFKRMVADGGAGGSVSGTSASGTASVTEAAPSPRVERWTNPPAAAVALFAQQSADFDITTASITQPTVARNVQAVFSAGWDGGNVEVTGIRMSGASGSETITAAAGTTVESVHGYQVVTRVRNLGTRTAGTVDVQTGPKLGVPVGALTPTLQAAVELGSGAVAGAALSANGLVNFNASPPDGSRDYVVTYTLANTYTDAGHTHGAGSYAGAPASSAVHYDRGEWTVSTTNASTTDTAVALCQALMQAYNNHIADALAHDAVDATNTLAYTRAQVVGEASAILAANDLKAKYNAHLTQSGKHPNNDTTNATSASDATNAASLYTLLNELKLDFNAHLADGMSTPSWRATDF